MGFLFLLRNYASQEQGLFPQAGHVSFIGHKLILMLV